jgi:hypothetical protein
VVGLCRPTTGVVADCMRRTRAAYRRAIRFVRQKEDDITRHRVADAFLHNDSRNFWSEIKRIRGSVTNTSRIVDGLPDGNAIARLFATKFRELYNSVSYNSDDMQGIIDDISDKLTNSQVNENYIVTIHNVKEAVSRLKRHKGDGCSDLTSDHCQIRAMYACNGTKLCPITLLLLTESSKAGC